MNNNGNLNPNHWIKYVLGTSSEKISLPFNNEGTLNWKVNWKRYASLSHVKGLLHADGVPRSVSYTHLRAHET